MNTLTSTDCLQLTEVHLECLPDSLVSRLGRRYTRAFYRYINLSHNEHVFVERDAERIVSGCVLSLDPGTLMRRLAFGSPLMWFAVLGVLRPSILRLLVGSLGRGEPASQYRVLHSSPEVILMFTAQRARDRGAGSLLLGECERFLTARGYGQYLVRTVDDESNAALRFYAKNGFIECGRCVQYGQPFRILRKEIGDGLPFGRSYLIG